MINYITNVFVTNSKNTIMYVAIHDLIRFSKNNNTVDISRIVAV